jgi:hypothetical protein
VRRQSNCDAKTQLVDLELDAMGIKILSTYKEMVQDEILVDPKYCPWEILYDTCPLHLVPVGTTPGLFVPMDDNRRYQRLLEDCLSVFYLVNSHGTTPTDVHRDIVGKYLFRLSRIKKYRDILSYERWTISLKLTPDNAIPCILNLHKRIIKKLVSMLFKEAPQSARSSNNAAR